jgi:dTDP-glucose 4,6-dehydratase
MKTVLCTGTLGFIFSNFIRHAVTLPGYRWVGVDKAARQYNLANWFEHPDYRFYLADIADAHTIGTIFERERPDIVIGGAAESFVDDSITDIMPFLRTNVVGTQTLVNACLKYGARYVHVSTDEVYGQQLAKDAIGWTENVPMAPRNPYAASKACAEHVVTAAHETHGLQYQITRSCNVYGPRQKKENLIPRIIYSLLHNEPVPIHGNGLNFRQYIHVDDAITALMCVIERGAINTTYNVGGEDILTNLEMVARIYEHIGMQSPNISHIEDRKAHDFGYKVSSNRLRELGWAPEVEFYSGIHSTIAHYRNRGSFAYAA